MYFRGEDILDNDWNQQLNEKDFLLQNPDMTAEQREDLIVDFVQDTRVKDSRLVGRFDIKMK